MITFADLSEDIRDDRLLPWLDRKEVPEEPPLTWFQKAWRDDGVVVFPKLIPDHLIEGYSKLREKIKSPSGWRCVTPYMHYEEIRDICLYKPLTRSLEMLLGARMGLHLNLTGWVSTERNWHQDDYLNPPFILAHYAAVWMALDEISADSGPFEFIRGSHRWPLLRRSKVLSHLPPGSEANPNWPKESESFVTAACEREITERGATPERFLAHRGDVLVWHGRLLHRGSAPSVPGKQRKSLIAHYSALTHRRDMPNRIFHTKLDQNIDGVYFELPSPLFPEEKV